MKWIKYGIFGTFIAFIGSLFFHVATVTASFCLPSLKQPLELYFSETKTPLRSVLLESIAAAKTSLLIVVYQ